ncbi:protein ZNRD2 isoform X2 [Taeniopygia guttata]|uniref:protein ZNRD2 isoform X2 n=1 Tax=Taeniopygia guttata TaxID=59729 RepID=UPI003BB8A564
MALNGGADEAEARRERLDRASRAMGALLLRGYRMLGSCCPECGTILLQDKEQRLLCVSCQEPEGGNAPRPERGSAAAAAPRGAAPAAPGADGDGAGAEFPACPGSAGAGADFPGSAGAGADFPGCPGSPGAAVAAARAALLQKLLWASRELPRTGSVDGSARLCRLMRDCAHALRGLRDLELPGSAPGTPPGHSEPSR